MIEVKAITLLDDSDKLSKRDFFAAVALMGKIASGADTNLGSNKEMLFAKDCYRMADAMVTESNI